MQRLHRFYARVLALPWIVRFGIMLAVIFLLALAVPRNAHAEDRIARQGADEVVITDRPCLVASVLIQIDKLVPGQREQFRRADAHFGGQKYFACWRPIPGGVHLIYEDGDQGIVPDEVLKPVMSI